MKRKAQGFTLVELLVIIVIIGVMFAALVPAIGATRGSARSATCINNLRQIGIAFSLFIQEHSDRVPYMTELLSYLGNNSEVLHCPDDKRPNNEISYSPNELTPDSINPAQITRPFSEIPLAIESDDVATTPEEKANIIVTREPSSFANRHMNGSRSNILYLDCSVAPFMRGQVLPAPGGGQIPGGDILDEGSVPADE